MIATAIKRLWRYFFFRKKIKAPPVRRLPVTQPALSDEDWSGDDYIFEKPKSSRRTIIRTRGKVHNLKKIFDRVNKEHFNGTIKAKITWGRYGCRNVKRRTTIILGTYSSYELLIRIHPALDQKEVPEFFVESVIHHEILHETLPPIPGSRSKWIIHHYKFRVAEAKTPTYKPARIWWNANWKLFFGEPKPKRNTRKQNGRKNSTTKK